MDKSDVGMSVTTPGPGAKRAGWLDRCGVLRARWRLPVLLWGCVLVVLSLQRLAVYLGMHERFGGLRAGLVLKAFWVGVRFDVVIAYMLVLPPLVVMIGVPQRVLAAKTFRLALAGWCGATMALAVLVAVVDFCFFAEFGLRLNYQVLDYARYPAVQGVIWQQYPVVTAVAGVMLLGLGSAWALLRWGLNERCCRSPLWQGIWPLLMIPLAVLGIRGSAGNRPLNTGAAYFSPSPALSQLALNGAYTLREAVLGAVRATPLSAQYELLGEDEAIERARKLLARPEDRFLADADNPLRRITDTGHPRRDWNVVVVMVESMSWHYVGAMGGDARVSPCLSALAEQGIFMDHCFAAGQRTAHARSAIMAGFPDPPGTSASVRSESEGTFLTLASILRQRGYETLYIHGGQSYFDHQQAFAGSNGYGRMYFEGEIPCRTFRSVAGWCDQDLYDSADALFRSMGERPFMATLMTLSFHRPFQIPAGKVQPVEPGWYYSAQLDAMRYSDWAIGQFIAKARQSPYFQRTIFVFVADHAGGYRQDAPDPVSSFRVPFIIYAPGIVGEPRRVPAVCSQTDVAPTIMSLLGGSYEHCFFGSSVLDRPAEAGRALMVSGDGEVVLMGGRGNAVMVPPGRAKPRSFHFEVPAQVTERNADGSERSAAVREKARDAMALLQTADALFRRRSYNVPAGGARTGMATTSPAVAR